jgi:hypothetical protein
MSHFSADEWVDFIRGLLPPAQATSMQAALAEGCRECRCSLQLWHSILEAFVRESAYQPAPAAVQAVKDAYRPEQPWQGLLAVAEWAQVLFDSLGPPAWAGVRSATKPNRQLTVEAEPFVIDLQLETDAARQRVALTGQVLNARTAPTMVPGADVVLLSADHLVQRTRANEWGEFCLDFSREPNLRLFINIRGERAIGIVLPDLESSDPREERGST